MFGEEDRFQFEIPEDLQSVVSFQGSEWSVATAQVKVNDIFHRLTKRSISLHLVKFVLKHGDDVTPAKEKARECEPGSYRVKTCDGVTVLVGWSETSQQYDTLITAYREQGVFSTLLLKAVKVCHRIFNPRLYSKVSVR
jgi:hypothetical protein